MEPPIDGSSVRSVTLFDQWYRRNLAISLPFSCEKVLHLFVSIPSHWIIHTDRAFGSAVALATIVFLDQKTTLNVDTALFIAV